MDSIDLTGDDNEMHNQVNSAEEGMGSMQVGSTNCTQAETSPSVHFSNNLTSDKLDSDEDLPKFNGGCRFPGLQAVWTMGKDEPDLEAPPVLTVEVTTEATLLANVSTKLIKEDPLPEMDFIGLDENQDSRVTAEKVDLLTTSNQKAYDPVCNAESTSNTSINSDLESLETFSPDTFIPFSSPDSAGDPFGDLYKSTFEETINYINKAGLSPDIEDIPSLISQNTKKFELEHGCDQSPPSVNMPLLEPWGQLQGDYKSDSELNCSLIKNKAHVPVPVLDQSEDQDLPSEETEDHVLTPNEAKEASPNCSVDKETLQSFQYLVGAPVQHVFVKRPRNEKWHKANQHSHSSTTHQHKSKEPELISQRQCSMINSTIDENFPQGTLQFLMDFVSPQHYPPHKIVEYIIKKILLGNESSSTIMSAYMTLMKIQQLHPANISTVQWDWNLLAYHVESKDPHRKHSVTKNDRLLFLQYVVQTLEDDFQLKRDMPHKTIAKAVLSCDDKFSNVRSVIKWLIDIISKDSDDVQQKNGPTSLSDNPQVLDSRISRVICLLQKMLTLAVEVDRSPVCSSNKIAEAMLQDFLCISKRSQRLKVLRSTESQLLRCKLLEFSFQHCTKKQNAMPMSLGKVLHFLKYAKFPLENDECNSSKWQYWEELVKLLCLLLLSYQEVTKRYLRFSITERLKYVLADAPPVLTTHDEITVEEVQSDMEIFYNRALNDLGTPLNPQLEEQISLLKALLLCAATRT
ncbi:SUMO-interacting motif-containing protein 1 isoform X2 [Stegostoma tigrinum]|uniref:SUMO-interacting motif-containing protein 1 isoform X2 n=1 Tax=Stegostoma tigrinum TaxID=3053191 RepID=UPI00202B9A62|nr:SUMO-interacting motif-containing protein 1 isoform X2 [Stegostoma tigrinum]XP_048399772.1 SUMO-interacting motif-containing protein 1 isoform X2 [Stegostoma tigrinum]XP_048399773.1 SUMO-interacting motif-containing protein 1 isoform X2 [Stegostoma tigrinum]